MDSQKQVISDISVHPQNVFDLSDPSQSNLLISLANKLHITTRPYFIQRQLLFKHGDPYDPFLIYESERLLRDFSFIRNASITGADKKNIRIDTRDAWSTIPELSYGTEGGEETWSAGIKEKNLLGFGKTAAAYYRKELDRTYREVYYEDPCFIVPRWKGGFNYQRDNDKKSHIYYISRPFYSSLTPWEVFFSEDHTRRSVFLYTGGEKHASWLRDRQDVIIGAGASIGSTTTRIQRVRGSYYMRDEMFDREYQTGSAAQPADKKMKGFRVSFEHAFQDYYKTQYVNTFDRMEDWNTGNELFLGYGYTPEQWASDKTRHLVKVSEQKGFRIGSSALYAFASGEGRVEDGKRANFIEFYHLYHYTRFSDRNTLVSSLNFEQGINLDPEEQILLGGATGLRGYSVKQFEGSKKLMFNIEYRTFWIDDLLKLVSIGGILFFDSGFVWHDDRQVDLRDLRSDIGFGLRLDPTRGRGATPFNISLAYALNKNNENSRWVLTISGKPDLLNTVGIPDEKYAGEAHNY